MSLAKLAMRLRAVTARPPHLCKQFLEDMAEASRIDYVEYMESNDYSLFIDPVELDPKVRAMLATLRSEADRLREQGEFGRGMGSGGCLLVWIKRELLKRHGITWRTRHEMNPDCSFD